MREFILYSRTGRTDGKFRSLMDGGRLDIAYQCMLMALFKSQSHRGDCVFHAVLNGPPSPPVCISIEGETLRDAHIDERSWEAIFRKLLSGGEHPGIAVSRKSMQALVAEKHRAGYRVFVLEAAGEPMESQDFSGDSLFVVGDHIGIPKNDERFILRYGRKMSLGRGKYLAASCIDIVNYWLDKNYVVTDAAEEK